MALPTIKRVPEIIDLTLDDDDKDRQSATGPPLAPLITDNSSLAIDQVTPRNATCPQSATTVTIEPPLKRVKLSQDQHTVQPAVDHAISAFAKAGAEQAAKENPHIDEAVLRKKLYDALYNHFAARVQRSSGFISNQLRSQIINASRNFVVQYLVSSEARPQKQPHGINARVCGPSHPPNVPRHQNNPAHTVGNSFTPRPPGPNSALNGFSPSPTTVSVVSNASGSQLHSTAVTPVISHIPIPPTESKTSSPVVDLEAENDAEMRRDAHGHVPQAVRESSTTASRRALSTVTATSPSTQRQLSVKHSSISKAQNIGSAIAPRATKPLSNKANSPRSTRQAKGDNVDLASSANFHAQALRAPEAHNEENEGAHFKITPYFALARRPYLDAKTKAAVLSNSDRLSRLRPTLLQEAEVFHVDFTSDEIRKVQAAVRTTLGRDPKETDDPFRDLAKLLKKLKREGDPLTRLARGICPEIPRRDAHGIRAFLDDVVNRRLVAKELRAPQILTLDKDSSDKRGEELRESRLSSLLMAREIYGGKGSMRTLHNFPNEFRKHFEERLELRTEFTNCAGDISTVSWVSNDAYLAGTTVHMDSHNQQYNKPSNLVLGSVARRSATLQAYSDHRIPRPIIDRGQNSTEAMRESQDPWLYTSVVCSDYDPVHDRIYTSGFDKKVKVWKVDKSGGSMRCIQTWAHEGAVNFVQASSLEFGNASLVATAADVPADAIRIYRVPLEDAQIGQSSFVSLSCSRITNLDGTPLITDKWTYFPSTMKWGIATEVKHMLLVGYSPRSLTNDDNDIPSDRLNTGELCLWDALSGSRITITAAKTQNVFEVLWHPSQPIFIAATSPTGEALKDASVKTQVRVFQLVDNNGYSAFSQIKALDCAADDINELTIMPNSVAFSYVTAGCTDGKAYVWDTALSDKPIQVLAHGAAFEGVTAGDDEDDTGVKFTAWGKSLDHFYTGSSDGIVKVWNVRSTEGKAKGRVILEAAAQISFGAFSPDRSRLVIGDASGRVFVLSVDEEDGNPPQFDPFLQKFGIQKRRPTAVTPHPPPPPPNADTLTNQELGHVFVVAHQLQYSGDPTIGMVQGANYAETGLFEASSHADYDPKGPILGHISSRLQENVKIYADSRFPVRTRRLRQLTSGGDGGDEHDEARVALCQKHAENCSLDLRFAELSLEVRDMLARNGISERDLVEGPQYAGLMEEDDEGELRRGRVEIIRDEGERQTRVWV